MRIAAFVDFQGTLGSRGADDIRPLGRILLSSHLGRLEAANRIINDYRN